MDMSCQNNRNFLETFGVITFGSLWNVSICLHLMKKNPKIVTPPLSKIITIITISSYSGGGGTSL